MMVAPELVERNFFLVLCTSFLLFYGYKSFSSFLEKTTARSVGSEALSADILPQIVVEKYPCFNLSAAHQHGYHGIYDYVGKQQTLKGRNLTAGWNGRNGTTDPFELLHHICPYIEPGQIIEKTLLVREDIMMSKKLPPTAWKKVASKMPDSVRFTFEWPKNDTIVYDVIVILRNNISNDLGQITIGMNSPG